MLINPGHAFTASNLYAEIDQMWFLIKIQWASSVTLLFTEAGFLNLQPHWKKRVYALWNFLDFVELRWNFYVFYQDFFVTGQHEVPHKKIKINRKYSVTCICTRLFDTSNQVLLQLQLKALSGGSLPALRIDHSEFLPILLWQKIAPVQSDGMESNCEAQFSSTAKDS